MNWDLGWIWAVGITEKKILWSIMSKFLSRFFQVFMGKRKEIIKKLNFFLPLKTWKNHAQKLLMIGPNPFFQYCQSAQIQPKYKFLFHKNLLPRDFSIMTLSALPIWKGYFGFGVYECRGHDFALLQYKPEFSKSTHVHFLKLQLE